jgi:nicotinamide riboside transporter PnuC
MYFVCKSKLYFITEERKVEDTNEVIWSGKWKKDRQHNGQKKKDKHSKQKTKDWAMLIPLKTVFTLKLKHLIFGYKISDNNYYGVNYFITILSFSIYKSYYLSEQKTKNVNI